jgi:adenylate cyclase
MEIERKFLVRGAAWRAGVTAVERLCQGYLANTPACSIRVRKGAGRATISVKGMQSGRSRPEFEYAIPQADAERLLAGFAQGALVEKLRHIVPVESERFEVDEFAGANRGLVLAEIELAAEDAEFVRPEWLGDEVTDDARFYNFRLAARPISSWEEGMRRAVLAGRRPGGADP